MDNHSLKTQWHKHSKNWWLRVNGNTHRLQWRTSIAAEMKPFAVAAASIVDVKLQWMLKHTTMTKPNSWSSSVVTMVTRRQMDGEVANDDDRSQMVREKSFLRLKQGRKWWGRKAFSDKARGRELRVLGFKLFITQHWFFKENQC